MALKKKTKNILAIFAAGAAVYLGGWLLIGQAFVPQSFQDARVRAAKTAGELVSMLNESNKNLDQIAGLERKYQYGLASEMVSQELQRSGNINSKAVELSNEFQTMAESLGAVMPVKARNLADAAIKDDLKLIEKIIGYNSSLKSLLQVLDYKFSGDIKGDSDEGQKIIETMNAYAKEINELNSSYNKKMEEFDKLTE